MKCIDCKKQFSTKGQVRCPERKKNICDFCYNLGAGDHHCDMSCKNMKLPKINYFPLTTAWAGFSPTGTQKCTTEEFLPRAYHYLVADKVKYNISVIDLRKLRVKIEYNLEGNEKIQGQIYSNEGWRQLHLNDYLKDAGVRLDDHSVLCAPITVFFLDPFLRVMPESVNLKIDNRKRKIITNDTPEMIGMPDCYPPPKEEEGKKRSDGDMYSWFYGKSVVFYGPIQTSSSYTIEFEVEAINFNYNLGLLLPFRDVLVDTVDIDPIEKFPVANPIVSFTPPVRATQFPPKQEYNWNRPFGSKPALDLASAFRKQYFIGDFQKARVVPLRDFKSKTRVKDYAVIHQAFLLGLNKAYFPHQVMHDIQVSTSPIPIRIYEQVQKLPDYRDLLVTFDIISFKKKATKFEVTSEIEGYTNVQIDNVEIPAYGGGESSRKVISQRPKLKRGVLKDMTMPETASLQYKIFELDGVKRTLIEQGTKEIELLANDQIIWSLKDAKGSMTYDLGSMIGAWIYPDDPSKKLDKIRGASKNYHPQSILRGPSNLADETLQVKALFDYLSSETNISYVSHAFKHGMGTGAQRVLTPENVIDAESGNCIDLTALFASLMEGLGINPLVFLTNDHAFLGWGNKRKTDEMGFLECTLLGIIDPSTGKKYSFEKASKDGEENFRKEFLMIGSDDPMPFVMLGGNQIVDISEVRKKGIYRSS